MLNRLRGKSGEKFYDRLLRENESYAFLRYVCGHRWLRSGTFDRSERKQLEGSASKVPCPVCLRSLQKESSSYVG